MGEFWELMERYSEAFGEYFPTEEFYGSEADMMTVIEGCIEAGKPYETEDEEADY